MSKTTTPKMSSGSNPPANEQSEQSLKAAQAEREALLDAQRQAHRDDERAVKEDSLTDKRIHIEPDGTGPTPTRSFDAPVDEAAEDATKVPAKRPVR